jgi:hypothetical protein
MTYILLIIFCSYYVYSIIFFSVQVLIFLHSMVHWYINYCTFCNFLVLLYSYISQCLEPQLSFFATWYFIFSYILVPWELPLNTHSSAPTSRASVLPWHIFFLILLSHNHHGRSPCLYFFLFDVLTKTINNILHTKTMLI